MEKYIGKNLIAHERIENFNTGKLKSIRKTLMGVITNIDGDKVYIYNENNPCKYKWYTIEIDKFNKYLNEKLYTIGRKQFDIYDYMLQ